MSLQYRATLNRENMNAAFMSKTEDNNIIGAIYTPSDIRGGSLTSAGNLSVDMNTTLGGTLNVAGSSSFVGTMGLANTLSLTNSTNAEMKLTGGNATFNLNRLSTAFDNNLSFSTGGTAYWKIWQDNNQNLMIRDISTSKDIMTFEDNTGMVGIGTTNPSWQLTVSNATGGDTSYTGGILIENTSATSGEAAIGFKNISTGSNFWAIGVNQSADLDIAYGAIYSDTETKLTILSNGNVGINVLAPAYKLSVGGTLNVTNATTLSSTLSVTGAATFLSTLDVTGTVTAPTFDGNATTATNADNADTVDNFHLNQDVRTTASPTFPNLTLNIAQGTAPLIITSTTAVSNLNADLLDGNHSSAFAAATHGTHVSYGTTTTSLASGGTGVIGSATTLARSDHSHTLPAYPTSLPANGGNADTIDGVHASSLATSTHNHGLTRYSLSGGTIDGLTTTNFRTTLFGSTTSGANLSAARWNTTPVALPGLTSYGTMIAWSGSDTHGFLAVNYNGRGARIGGGSGDLIGWSAKVWLEGDSITSAVWNDLAEYMECNKDSYSSGDAIAVDDYGKLYKTNKYNQSNVVGVYSDTFGFSLGGEHLENEEKLPIGISGRVNVKVVYKEDLKVGDLLVSSEKSGYAVKASPNKANHIGCIIGKVTSLEPIRIIENGELKNTITDDMVTMIIMLA